MKYVKHLFTLLIAVLLSLALVSCSSDDDIEDPENDPSTGSGQAPDGGDTPSGSGSESGGGSGGNEDGGGSLI